VERLRAIARREWNRLKTAKATPREVALAVGLGAFVGCSPALGLHGVLAVALASALKQNRLFAFAGSRVSNAAILPFVILAEIQLAHRLRTGQWAPAVDRAHVLAVAPSLALDWLLGSLPIGAAMGVGVGGAAYAIASHRARLRAPGPKVRP
jgi:uncharacterized protein (DUF2062 family)